MRKKHKIAIGVISAVMVIASLIWFFLPAETIEPTITGEAISNSNETITKEVIEEGDGCPLEFNRDFFYGLLSSRIDTIDYKYMKPDQWEFLDNKGEISGYFSWGSLSGQNINYMYSNPDMFYERWPLDEEGFIIDEKWNVELVYDPETCVSLGWYNIPDKMEDSESFMCHLVYLKCSKL